MNRLWPLLCLWFAPATLSHPAPLPWIETGHKVIALIAWEELTPKTKIKVGELLQQHPQFAADLQPAQPGPSLGAVDDGLRLPFAAASVWPDVVRNEAHPMHKEAHHAVWHYINLPYSIGGQEVPEAKPETKTGPRDIVEALAKCTADLRDPKLAAADKAIALCWVLHLCGDIHQPLHACTLFSPQFPTGDSGGNSFVVLRDPPHANSQMNLHFLWDSLPGSFKSADLDACLALGLRGDARFTREQFRQRLAVVDFAAWAGESHELAIEHAYLKGALEAHNLRDAKRTPKDAIPGLPAGYLEQAERVAMSQVVLAAHRTADLLNSIFDAK